MIQWLYAKESRPRTKKLWAEKVLDLANIAAGAMIFGQIISGQKFSWSIAAIGLALVVAGYITSYFLTQE